VVNHWKPRGLGVTSRQSPLMTWPPRRPGLILALRFNQRTVHDFVLLFLPPCGLHLIPLVTRSLETSIFVCPTPGGAHWHRPFALVLHLHQHQSSRNLHLQYLAKSPSTQRCQSLITPGSDHPPILEPHRSSSSYLSHHFSRLK
jgi:hypothetical protein